MTNEEKSQNKYDLEERISRFAHEAIKFAKRTSIEE